MSARPIADVLRELQALVDELPKDQQAAAQMLIDDAYRCWQGAVTDTASSLHEMYDPLKPLRRASGGEFGADVGSGQG